MKELEDDRVGMIGKSPCFGANEAEEEAVLEVNDREQ